VKAEATGPIFSAPRQLVLCSCAVADLCPRIGLTKVQKRLNNNLSTPSWRFAVRWMMATTAALLLMGLVYELTFVFLGYAIFAFILFAGVFPGFSVGTLQWLVLRRVVPTSGYWMVVTVFAFTATGPLTLWLAHYLTVQREVPSDAGGLVACGVGAAVIGFAQAALLRQWTRRAPLWVPASIAGWVACAALLLEGPLNIPILSPPADRFLSWVAGRSTQSGLGVTLLGGLAAGSITGIALMWVLPGRVDARDIAAVDSVDR
jgi:hypothetical protein